MDNQQDDELQLEKKIENAKLQIKQLLADLLTDDYLSFLSVPTSDSLRKIKETDDLSRLVSLRRSLELHIAPGEEQRRLRNPQIIFPMFKEKIVKLIVLIDEISIQ